MNMISFGNKLPSSAIFTIYELSSGKMFSKFFLRFNILKNLIGIYRISIHFLIEVPINQYIILSTRFFSIFNLNPLAKQILSG